MKRTDVTFQSHGTECAAWLYEPDSSPAPIVVMAHGFSATRELRLDAYAERFRDAGLGVLLFDYRGFGASQGEPRQVVDVAAQLEDWRAAIVYARGVPWADATRVALFGSSFSGGHVTEIAAQDHTIAAIVAQCPFQDGRASVGTVNIASLARLMTLAIQDQIGAWLGRDPVYIPAVAAPGELGVMTTPDSEPGFKALVPPGSLWENRVAARILLHLPMYRPGTKADSIYCPALWCITDTDTLCPAGRTEQLALKAPRGEIKHYPIGHFDIYAGEWFEKAVSDQTEFLVRHLIGPQTKD